MRHDAYSSRRMKTLRTIKFESEYGSALADIRFTGDSDPLLLGYLQDGWTLVDSEKDADLPRASNLDRIRRKLPNCGPDCEP